MISHAEAAELAAELAVPEVGARVAMLWVLVEDPTGHPVVRAAVEALLDDRRAAMLQAPIQIGEVRWLAAHALAAERKAAGIDDPVRLTDVIGPVALTDLPGHGTPLARFEQGRAAGRLPLENLEC